MGLFSFSSSSATNETRADEVRNGAVAPDRSERARCWEARDAYFACLDRANVIDPVKEDKAARAACSAENTGFENNCATSWVKYFKQWRVADIQKKARIAQLEAEGAIKMDVSTSFNAGGGAGPAAPAPSAAPSGVPKGTSREDIQEMLLKRKP
ncbi:cytochrome oxidase c subunit VIb-domain-containing protein [Plectosphaerella plurivora]|uniref:Cytochrome oxidase c subunit VIb-domain-containing protein n=1 Tax=Plectosphaerella plurivora TaxID=936078 RepID=A0A9P8V2T2_9PEZI|nr:cytochrome oxidase c subunit VIb-domain-containing protein [Plectosphaerella plurivora]